MINKVDRPDARIAEVVDETYELFLDLDADEEQIDFPIVYACARDGVASLTQPEDGTVPTDSDVLEPLFRTLLDTIPAPAYEEDAPLQAHVTNLDASPFLGRLALCRVRQGTIRKGQTVAWCRTDGTHRAGPHHRAADDRGAGAQAGRVGRPGRHHRDRRHPGHHDRRDAGRPRRTRARCR